MDKNKRYIKLNISDYSCPTQFQEAYIKEICEKENVKVIEWYRYEERTNIFPGVFKGTIVLLEGEL
jgi:hypothetical protein